MKTTKIEWTDRTWNPITGCTKHSAGCAHCYAETMARRLCSMHLPKYKNAFQLTLHPKALNEPKQWKKGHNIFVCSMSDLFHEQVPFEFIDKVMQTIEETPQHRFQLLTKRPERMEEYFRNHKVPKNAWLGTTVENRACKNRIAYLQSIPNVTVRFLSCEPLLEDLGDLDLRGIHWVIVGGESGPLARSMNPVWVKSIQKQSKKAGAAFFFKQWGTWGPDGIKRSKHANGKLLDGKIQQAMPK